MKTSIRISKQIISVLFISGLILACSKDGNDGDLGPQGPQGEQGPTGLSGVDGLDGADGLNGDNGTNGADGADGADGETGTANVIFSNWIDSEFDNNIILVGAGFDIDVTQLTQANIDEAAVMVFGRNVLAFGPPVVFPLPYINNSNQYSFRIEEAGTLRITINSLDNTAIGSPFFEDYRYIIIPGGNSAAGFGGPGGLGDKNSSINFTKMTYEELIHHFNIDA